jgi:putative endonuclease
MHYVYIIKNDSNQVYVGITKDPNKRASTHNKKQGAKYTKYKPDYKIVFLETYESLKEARKREIQIKKWRREKKEMLIDRYEQGLETKQ